MTNKNHYSDGLLNITEVLLGKNGFPSATTSFFRSKVALKGDTFAKSFEPKTYRLKEHESCEKLYREMVEQLNGRSLLERTSENYATISATVRLRMKQFANELQQLKYRLDNSYNLTQEEAERRHRLIETLQSRNVQLLHWLNDRDVVSAGRERRELLSSGGKNAVADLGTTGWALDDDDDDEPLSPTLPLLPPTQQDDLSVGELRRQQQWLLQDQDKGLEVLSTVISRQKDIAVTINSEVDLQNNIVDDLSERMDQTNTSIQRETTQIKVISRKDSTFGYWLVITILFVTIVGISLV